ncbi:MAG: zinc metalloprotease HtpX, partial [Chloroflexota bacterium]
MAATFYDQIGANKRNSVLLALFVVLLLAALGMAIGTGVTGYWQGGLAAMAIAIVIAIIASLVSYYAGDSIVLATSGARKVTAEELPQLINVVQEMAVAASVPMPAVYLIDDSAPNAFATGRDPEHASVAITTGLLQKLDREELQGVMAHELSHVRNFDIRFSLMVGVLVGSIALLADFFLRFTFWGGIGRSGRRSSSSSDSGSSGIQVLFMIIALVLAILAPIVARFVQMAISRQREYLADASGVELTRNPYGLERALAKISLDTEPLEVANRATQHLYFENPIKGVSGKSSNLFSTHPPVMDRINRLRELTSEAPITDPRLVLGQTTVAGTAVAAPREGGVPGATGVTGVTPGSIPGAIGFAGSQGPHGATAPAGRPSRGQEPPPPPVGPPPP